MSGAQITHFVGDNCKPNGHRDAATQYDMEMADGRRCPYCGSDEREDRRIVARVGPELEYEQVDTCEAAWHSEAQR